MALPSSGQISFADFHTEQALAIENASFVNMFSSAGVYGVSFTTDGNNPASMDEFYGKEAPRYDVYEALLSGGIVTYFVPFSSGNPSYAQFGDDCFEKLTGPPGIKYGDVLNAYPFANFLPNAGGECGGGGESPF
jgi:hypothetical protein